MMKRSADFPFRHRFGGGGYDYKYASDGRDNMMLEGNDWRTVNVYTALLCYHDFRFGGFDRIMLAAQKKSPGGISETLK
jgi:hypothetical protein